MPRRLTCWAAALALCASAASAQPLSSLTATVYTTPPAAAPAAPSAEEAETTALVARMPLAPNAPRRALINALVAGLKADGVWSKLDWLVVFAAHAGPGGQWDGSNGLVNWVRNSTPVSIPNSPTFTVDRGYAGDGGGAYLDMGEAFGAGGGNYALNNAGLGIWINQQGALTGAKSLIRNTGSGLAYIAATNSGSGGFGVNQSGATTRNGDTSRAAHWGANRTSSTSTGGWVNGVKVMSATPVSNSLPAGNVHLLRFSTTYADDRVAAAYWGALNDANMAAMHNRLSIFLTAIGAN